MKKFEISKKFQIFPDFPLFTKKSNTTLHIRQLFVQADVGIFVSMTMFDKIIHVNKAGKEVKHLKATLKRVNVPVVIDLIAQWLRKIMHHRNQLNHYRNTIHSFRDNFNAVFLDTDFSENLKVQIKSEPQSLNWSHEQVTVHSGIMKINGEKIYYPTLSEDKKHNQAFVRTAVSTMVSKFEEYDCCLIKSDNCHHYKSAESFHDSQDFANKWNIPVI